MFIKMELSKNVVASSLFSIPLSEYFFQNITWEQPDNVADQSFAACNMELTNSRLSVRKLEFDIVLVCMCNEIYGERKIGKLTGSYFINCCASDLEEAQFLQILSLEEKKRIDSLVDRQRNTFFVVQDLNLSEGYRYKAITDCICQKALPNVLRCYNPSSQVKILQMQHASICK